MGNEAFRQSASPKDMAGTPRITAANIVALRAAGETGMQGAVFATVGITSSRPNPPDYFEVKIVVRFAHFLMGRARARRYELRLLALLVVRGAGCFRTTNRPGLNVGALFKRARPATPGITKQRAKHASHIPQNAWNAGTGVVFTFTFGNASVLREHYPRPRVPPPVPQ